MQVSTMLAFFQHQATIHTKLYSGAKNSNVRPPELIHIKLFSPAVGDDGQNYHKTHTDVKWQ